MQFGYYDNFDTFQIIKKVDYSGGYDAGVKGSYSTGQEYQFFDIMLVGGKMYIGLGGEVVKMVIPDARYAVDGTPIATIVWAEFQSYWSQTCSFSIHPTKFVAEATALSTQFVIGFESNSDPTYDVIPAPGWEDNVREVNVTYTVLTDPRSAASPVVDMASVLRWLAPALINAPDGSLMSPAFVPATPPLSSTAVYESR